MKSLPKIAFKPRVQSDVRRLLKFIGRQPWGKAEERKQELKAAYERIRCAPLARPVHRWVSYTRVGLRCYYASRFAIVYAWFGKTEKHPRGLVSIRAVRHHRERDVFFGVKNTDSNLPWAPLQTGDAPSEAPP